MSTISFYRPDIFHFVDYEPIPLNPFESAHEGINKVLFISLFIYIIIVIPSVGELMLASFPSDPNFNESIGGKEWYLNFFFFVNIYLITAGGWARNMMALGFVGIIYNSVRM